MIVVAGEALVDLVEEGGVQRAVPGGGPLQHGDRARPARASSRLPRNAFP